MYLSWFHRNIFESHQTYPRYLLLSYFAYGFCLTHFFTIFLFPISLMSNRYYFCGAGRGFCTAKDMAKRYNCYRFLFGPVHFVPSSYHYHVGFTMLVILQFSMVGSQGRECIITFHQWMNTMFAIRSVIFVLWSSFLQLIQVYKLWQL
jgi:hypothetical protein